MFLLLPQPNAAEEEDEDEEEGEEDDEYYEEAPVPVTASKKRTRDEAAEERDQDLEESDNKKVKAWKLTVTPKSANKITSDLFFFYTLSFKYVLYLNWSGCL